VTTPAYSPQSNGMAEAFVKTLKRDYVDGADLSTAAAVLEQLPRWVADYNGVAPHSALGYRTPREYRAQQQVQQTAQGRRCPLTGEHYTVAAGRVPG
jgi:transposase InsO family protein